MKHAYDHGAQNWDRAKRREFANDPENLIVVDASANREKGDKGPSRWMPPNQSYHCEYIKRWKDIKFKYRLKDSPEESKKLKELAGKCK